MLSSRCRKRPSSTAALLAPPALWALCALCGCSGSIHGDDAVGADDGDGARGNPRSSASPGSDADDDPAGDDADGVVGPADDPRIAPRIWRLTSEQLDEEVRLLFGEGAPRFDIPEVAAEYGITNIAANGVVDLGNAARFADGARAIATWVVQQREATTRCASYGTPECVQSVLDWLPRGAFRRPVSTDERAELEALFTELEASYDHDYALAGLIRAVLLSPDFLYRTELGDGSGVMTDYEIANLLALSITDRSPDAMLLDAADRGELRAPDAREAQARRLMDDSDRAWQRFFWEWLAMATLHSQGQEVGLDAALVAQMEEEYRAFVREVVVTERGSLRELLSAPYTWLRPELAAHYGVEHPGGGLARVALDPAQRGGLLTQGAWLVSHGKRGRDNVVRRGMNIYKQAMCNNDLAPPPGLDVQAELLALVGPDATVRETVEARGQSPTCGGCHRLADPVGMVFETFTSDGRYQATYPDGRPVDSQVELDGIGSFDDARSLAAALADDLAFQRCFVRRLTHFLVGIDLGSPSLVAWTDQAHARFAASDTSLEELLVAIVRYPAFIERPEGSP